MLHMPRFSFKKTLTSEKPDYRDNRMARRIWGLVDIEAAFTLFEYERGCAFANAVHKIKYKGRKDLAEDMGEMMGEVFRDDLAEFGIDMMIPVPLTKERMREREYNQSEWIARGISNITGIPVCTNVLQRAVFNGSQTHLNVKERQQNVENAFQLVEGTPIVNKHVLLIDDVMTTGSTLKACALQLKQVEGVKVSIGTLGITKF